MKKSRVIEASHYPPLIDVNTSPDDLKSHQVRKLGTMQARRFLTNGDVANCIGVDVKTYQNYKNGKTCINFLTSVTLNKIFNQFDHNLRYELTHLPKIGTGQCAEDIADKCDNIFERHFEGDYKQAIRLTKSFEKELFGSNTKIPSDIVIRNKYYQLCCEWEVDRENRDLEKFRQEMVGLHNLKPECTHLAYAILNDIVGIEFSVTSQILKNNPDANVDSNISFMIEKLTQMKSTHPEIHTALWNLAEVYNLIKDEENCIAIWDEILSHPHADINGLQAKPMKVDGKKKVLRLENSKMLFLGGIVL